MAPLGNFIRLTPLQLDELPAHPALETRFQTVSQQNVVLDVKDDSVLPTENPTASNGTSESTRNGLHSARPTFTGFLDATGRPNLAPFIKTILDEAITFVDKTISSTFTDSGFKSSPPSIAKVRLLKRTITGDELSQIPWKTSIIHRTPPQGIKKASEAWVARGSTHTNQSLTGTASWSELDSALRTEHSYHERLYTPDVFDAYKVLEWELGPDPADMTIGKYSEIAMSIYEMCHKLPFPLAPRVFPVLIITAKSGTDGLIVVQIPVALESLPEAFYSNGRNLIEGGDTLQKKKAVLGIYTSVERCILRENPDTPSKGEIIWMMATASDARGWLPMWMQKLGVPGAVIKDVGLVMKWVQEVREKFREGFGTRV